MADWEEVRRVALGLPETSERPAYGSPPWRVRDRIFAWERPLRPREIDELGAAAPTGPILGARVEDLVAKEALLAVEPELYFTTSHFDAYPAVPLRLERIDAAD